MSDRPEWKGLASNAGYSKELWDRGIEATNLQSNWLDYLFIPFPLLRRLLWAARVLAWCRGFQDAKEETAPNSKAKEL